MCSLHVQPVSFVSLALTAATGGTLLMYYNHLMEQKLKKSESPSVHHNRTRHCPLS